MKVPRVGLDMIRGDRTASRPWRRSTTRRACSRSTLQSLNCEFTTQAYPDPISEPPNVIMDHYDEQIRHNASNLVYSSWISAHWTWVMDLRPHVGFLCLCLHDLLYCGVEWHSSKLSAALVIQIQNECQTLLPSCLSVTPEFFHVIVKNWWEAQCSECNTHQLNNFLTNSATAILDNYSWDRMVHIPSDSHIDTNYFTGDQTVLRSTLFGTCPLNK